MKLFNHILTGEEATEQNAYDHAQGLDWSQCETTEQDKPAHSQYVDSVNRIGIWYCYGTDHYFFEEETEEEMTEEKNEAFREDLSGVLNRSDIYKSLKDLTITHTGKTISNDSQVWHELEELIVNKLIEETKKIEE